MPIHAWHDTAPGAKPGAMSPGAFRMMVSTQGEAGANRAALGVHHAAMVAEMVSLQGPGSPLELI